MLPDVALPKPYERFCEIACVDVVVTAGTCFDIGVAEMEGLEASLCCLRGRLLATCADVSDGKSSLAARLLAGLSDCDGVAGFTVLGAATGSFGVSFANFSFKPKRFQAGVCGVPVDTGDAAAIANSVREARLFFCFGIRGVFKTSD